jgi:osmotically-inducible protein OsmY
MSDQPIEQAIMRALAGNPHVHASEIAVQDLGGGDVILRGTVGSLVQHAEAVRTTRRVPGVHNVEDELAIRPLDVDGRADADTQAAVLDALIDDEQVQAADVRVEARNGVVTLRGLVEYPAQRDRAERVALRVGGVTEVHNELGVWLTVSADDVAERVTNAIGVDAVVGADRIGVRVRDNDVTLTGTVGSPEHRDAAVAAAAGAPGVADVHDEIIIRT